MVSLHSDWRQLARRLAVGAGALCALLSLIQNAPPHVASLRGALTAAGVLAVARLGLFALERAVAADRQRATTEEGF